MTTILSGAHHEGAYSFASQPKVVTKRNIFRNTEDEFEVPYGNLMYDRRVIRGNTYALNVLPSHNQPDLVEIQRKSERKRRAAAHHKIRDELQPKSPLPLEGRLDQPVQTELYLEALSEQVGEADAKCQTDAFLFRPPTPLFIPSKVGIDCATQINENDLFDFDLEVIPILEVIVGKTMEQSLLEVNEEEEMANVRMQQYKFEEIHQCDLLEVQRLEERERRIQLEKETRRQQCLLLHQKEMELLKKTTAQVFAKAYLSDLQSNVFKNLITNGYFYDPVERDIEEGFLPWLMNEIDEEIAYDIDARRLLDGMIKEIVQERYYEYRQLELTEIVRSSSGTAGDPLTQDDETAKQEVNPATNETDLNPEQNVNSVKPNSPNEPNESVNDPVSEEEVVDDDDDKPAIDESDVEDEQRNDE